MTNYAKQKLIVELCYFKTTHNFRKMYKLLVETKRGNLGTSAVSTCIFRPLKIYYPQQQAVSSPYSYFNSQDNISPFKNPALSPYFMLHVSVQLKNCYTKPRELVLQR